MKQRNLGLKSKSKKKRIILISIAFLIILATIVIYFLQSNMTDLEDISDFEYDNSANILLSEDEGENTVEPGIEIVDVSDMPSKANGFSVLGQIVLEKIDIKCYIFDSSSKQERLNALKVRHC